MRRQIAILITIILMTVVQLCAQGPVTAALQTTPPFTPFLQDYTNVGANKLFLTLIMNDNDEQFYQARLKVKITGNGITLETSPLFIPNPLTLNYLIPQQMTGADLAQYFNPNNLTFQGITRQQYLENSALPEGNYTICIQAYDYDRFSEEAISNEACSNIFIIEHVPPVVLTPIGEIEPNTPQNMAIEWQSRHIGAFPVQYTLELYEFHQDYGLTFDQTIDATSYVFQTTTMGITNYQYKPTDPPLKPDQKYIIRVQAKDISNQNYFRNNGYSQIELFTYGAGCQIPTSFDTTSVGVDQINLAWVAAQAGYAKYNVRYRDEGFANSNWYTDEILLNNDHTISDLVPGSTYEIQIKNSCSGGSSTWSPPLSVTTRESTFDEEDFECGASVDAPIVASEPVLLLAGEGDILTVGGFRMQVTEITDGSDGVFSGTGKLSIPWLGKVVNVEFEDIGVNSAQEVFDGEVVAISDGLEALAGLDTTYTVAVGTGFCPPAATVPPAGNPPPNYPPPPPPPPPPPVNGNGFNNPSAPHTPQLEELEHPDFINGYAYNGNISDLGVTNEFRPERTAYQQTLMQGIGLTQLIKSENRFANIKNGIPVGFQNEVNLPIGVARDTSNQLLALDGMVFTASGAKVDVYFVADIKSTGEKLVFSARDVEFSRGGFTGNPRLELNSNVSVVLNANMRLTIMGDESKTFVAFDCKGVTSMGIDAEIEFCRGKLIPWNDSTYAPIKDVTENVTARFEATMPEWGEFTAAVDIDPFVVRDLDSVVWRVKTAIFDFSTSETPDMVTFPENYEHPNFTDGSTAGWKGFYIQEASVSFPSFSKDTTKQKPITLKATDLIIDEVGFTSALAAYNLIQVDTGTVGSWAFGLDTLEIVIKANQFQSVQFNGQVRLPVFREDRNLSYAAFIQPGSRYDFEVALLDTLEIALWRAEAQFYPNSSIGMAYEDGEISGRATLNGWAQINAKVGSTDTLKIPRVNFQNFKVTTNKKAIEAIGTWSYTNMAAPADTTKRGKERLANFPLTINSITIGQHPEELDWYGLKIDADLHLMPDTTGGFSAGGAIAIYGSIDENNKPKFEKVEVSRLEVHASGAGYKLDGGLVFFEDDPVYGTGIKGALQVEFKPGLKVAAVAQFGVMKNNGNPYRYFYADALMKSETGVAIGTTGTALFGFGGGIYYHMRQMGFRSELPEGVSPVPPDTDPMMELGMSLSGVRYLPTPDKILGIKATVIAGTVRPEAFNGDLTFEIAFDLDDFSIEYIGFQGNGYFMTPPPVPPSTERGDPTVRANVAMSYDFNNEVLHAILQVYVYMHGGALKGSYENNLVGSAIIHFAGKDDWYIHIGHPPTDGDEFYTERDLAGNQVQKQPISLSAQIPGLDVPLGTLKGYLCMGSSLPDLPPLPATVTNILDMGDRERNESLASSGGGFMFGAAMEANTGRQEFAIFYGEFAMGVGVDIMLKNFGQDAYCLGRTGPVGIDGWYAMGQMWAYVGMDIGIHVDIFGYSGDYSIIEAYLAAALQAELPNPVWARGVVGGRYSILGGLIKGKCQFEVELGERCELVGGDVLAGVKIISAVSPEDQAAPVDVFNTPQAAFNMPINEIFSMKDRDGNKVEFRASLDKFEIRDNGVPVIGSLKWNATNDVVAFESFEILPGKRELDVYVRVTFEKKEIGKSWVPLMHQGSRAEEIHESKFTTGEAPDFIPHDNVAFSYPIISQFNYLKDEYTGRSYMQLKRGQQYLFENNPDFARKVQYSTVGENGSILTENASLIYDTAKREVTYDMYSGLQNNTIYKTSFINIPVGPNGPIDRNVRQDSLEIDGVGGEITIQQKQLDGTIKTLVEKEFFEMHFKTSQHNTFVQKIEALDVSAPWSFPVETAVFEVGVNMENSETFDKFEIAGYNDVAPLITYSADLNTNWFENTVKPITYENFPNAAYNINISWREDAELYGVPPSRAIKFRQTVMDKILTTDEVSINSPFALPNFSELVYAVPIYVSGDHKDFRQQAYNLAVNNNNLPQYMQDLIDVAQHPAIYPGNYPMIMEYRLPGKNVITSTRNVIMIKN